MDVEENVEIMVAAFIMVGLILVGGYFALQKSGLINKVSISEEQLKESVPEDQYNDALYKINQNSKGLWVIAIPFVIGGLVGFYLLVRENW